MALCDLHYFSPALGKQTGAYVILPEVGSGPYPVLYLLHGLSDDYTMWVRRSNIERYVANLPLIVVMPDGGRGFYSDAAQGFAYGTALGVELPDRIDRTFPTKPTRDGRAVAGLSMGGYGALKLALTYPERFAAAHSLSGATGWGHSATDREGKPLLPEWTRIVGDNPAGGPHDLTALAEKTAAETRPLLRIDCGVDDFLIESNRYYHEQLNTLQIPHEYVEYPGAHTWTYWNEHILDTLEFIAAPLGLPAFSRDGHL